MVGSEAIVLSERVRRKSIMTFLITVSLAVFGAYVLVWVIYRLRRRFPMIPLPSPLMRIGCWTDRLITAKAEDKTATFGDLVLFVTLWVIAFTLWFEFQKGAEEKYKEELGQAQTNATSLEGKLRDQEQRFQKLQDQIGLPLLKSPSADEQIIGDHVDLQWESRQRDSGQDYVIEVTQIAGNPGKVPIGMPCMYQASSSPVNESRYPISSDSAIASGTYIWRVGLGNLQINAPGGWNPRSSRNPQEDLCVRDESIRKWSEYSKFTVYGSQRERLFDTGEILVGTSFNQSTPFSRLGNDGQPTGFEIDLVQAIIQECIVRKTSGGQQEIQYDAQGCDRKVSADLKRIEAGQTQTPPRPCITSDCTLRARIIELGSGDDWREKMQRHNLDLYVGTLTRASSREKGDIHFTSGYLAFKSELLTNNEFSVTEIEGLKDKKKIIGALTNSTNAWLAEELLKDFPKFSLQLFSSLNELESSFEQKKIDLIIVDGVLERSMRGIGTKVAGLERTSAWKRYLRDKLGYGTEKFGIAVVDDVTSDASTHELRTAINAALTDEPIREWINYLYDYYDLTKYGTMRCNYKTDPCWERQSGL
jgi:ABC-type amino acid transport substrate-binding protein